MTSVRKIKGNYNTNIKNIFREIKYTLSKYLLRFLVYDKLPTNFPNTCVMRGPIIAPGAYKYISTTENGTVSVVRSGVRTLESIRCDQIMGDSCLMFSRSV